MFGWLFVSPAERRLIGTSSRRATTPWVIAIMSFSIMIIAATGLALSSTVGWLSEAIAARYAIEVPNGAQNLDALVATLREHDKFLLTTSDLFLRRCFRRGRARLCSQFIQAAIKDVQLFTYFSDPLQTG